MHKIISIASKIGLGAALVAVCGVAYADFTVSDTFTATTPVTTQAGRLFRDGIPGTCAGKAVPTIADAATHRYNTYTVQNTGAAACVQVNLIAQAGCTSLPFTVAYTPSFNPASVQTNYLSDTGFSNSGGDTQSMRFVAPANSTIAFDVHEVAAGTCSYTLQVIGLTNVVPTTSEWGLALLALILGSAAFLVIRRRGR